MRNPVERHGTFNMQTDAPPRSASIPARAAPRTGPLRTASSLSSTSGNATTVAAVTAATPGAAAAAVAGTLMRVGTSTQRRGRLSVRQSISLGVERDRVGSSVPEQGTNKRALVIFGMQQDFFGDLARPARLPVPGASRCATKVAQLLDLSFDAIIWVRMCHPINHCSFVENNPGAAVESFGVVKNGVITGKVAAMGRQSTHIDGRSAHNIANLPSRTVSSSASGRSRSIMQQVIRPAHCIEGTRGAAFHPDVRPSPRDRILKACTDPLSKSPGVPDELLIELLNMGPRLSEVYVCGIGVVPFIDVLVGRLMSSRSALSRNKGATFLSGGSARRGSKHASAHSVVPSPDVDTSQQFPLVSSLLQPGALAVYALEDICYSLNMSERSSGKSELVTLNEWCTQQTRNDCTNSVQP